MGKKDAEFHQRGYQLIHVPPGKDSADLKMATVGASIFVHYPTAKEIFVCSSDRALTHLSNTLQAHGLTVFQVRKQIDKIIVLKAKRTSGNPALVTYTGNDPRRTISYSAQRINQKRAKRSLNSVDQTFYCSALFRENYGLVLNQVVASSCLVLKPGMIFLNIPPILSSTNPRTFSNLCHSFGSTMCAPHRNTNQENLIPPAPASLTDSNSWKTWKSSCQNRGRLNGNSPEKFWYFSPM